MTFDMVMMLMRWPYDSFDCLWYIYPQKKRKEEEEKISCLVFRMPGFCEDTSLVTAVFDREPGEPGVLARGRGLLETAECRIESGLLYVKNTTKCLVKHHLSAY